MTFEEYLKVNGIRNDDYIYYFKKISSSIDIEDQEQVNNYFLNLSKTASPSLFNMQLNTLRKYYEYKNLNIQLPKSRKVKETLPEYIPYEDLENEIFPMVDVLFKNPLKVKCIILFLFVTGIRKQALFFLKRKDFNLDKKFVKIYEPKTQEEFIKPLTDDLIKYLKLYFSLEMEEDNAFNIRKTTIDKICKRLKPYYKKANLHPHIFRVSLAVHLLKKGVDLRKIQKILGHKNIQTTAKYLKLKEEDIIEGYNNYF